MGRNVAGRNVAGRNVAWGETSHGEKCRREKRRGEKCRPVYSTVKDSLLKMNPASGLLVLSIVTLKGAFKINELIKCNKK